MTVRFAGPRSYPAAALLRPCEMQPARGANDNGSLPADATLHAALRHYAKHGLAAATRARAQAEGAALAGDAQGYRWWLEVCRALDRPMARALEAAIG